MIATGFLSDNLGAIITLISAVTAAVVAIVNALSNKNQNKKLHSLQETGKKIENQTNGTLIAMQKDCTAWQTRALELQKVLDVTMMARRRRREDYKFEQMKVRHKNKTKKKA